MKLRVSELTAGRAFKRVPAAALFEPATIAGIP